MLTAIFLWNTSCLLLGKLLQETIFDGCLTLFFIGTPIIIVIISISNKTGVTLLMTSLSKFENGEKIQEQIREYMSLIDQKDFDRSANAILKAYIFFFEELCIIPDCALKKYLYNYEMNKIETVSFLFQHAETLYQNGISKFPNCTSLRIYYAIFLIERLNKKQQAKIELINAEKYSPTLEEQFIIYRYKKIIEEENTDIGEPQENLGFGVNIIYKNHFIQCNYSILLILTIFFL